MSLPTRAGFQIDDDMKNQIEFLIHLFWYRVKFQKKINMDKVKM